MLLLLLICLMKLVEMSSLNRIKRNCGGSTSSNNGTSSSSASSSSSILSSDSKENHNDYLYYQQQQQRQIQRISLKKQRQKIEQQLQQLLTPQQYLQLRERERDKKKLSDQPHQQQQQQFSISRSNSKKAYQNNSIPNSSGSGLNNGFFKGIKSHRGMTEYPTNELPSPHKSRLPHLSTDWSATHHQNQQNNTTHYCHNQFLSSTSTSTSPTNLYQQTQQQQTYKRPVTSPNSSKIHYNNHHRNYNHNNHGGISPIQQYSFSKKTNNFNNTTGAAATIYNHYNSSGGSINGLGCSSDDELTDEHLQRNVQIVLNNLDRYNNTLRSVILNEQINNLALSYNNNNNSNFKGMASGNLLASPEQADYNSNPPQSHHLQYISSYYNNGGGNNGGGGGTLTSNNIGLGIGNLNCSIASSHDFTHDNSDYQWFLDYGYRDGVPHQSVLSSLSGSYNGIGELSYYEDMAKNIDANLAEVDMESFRTEDIHSLLTHIPTLFKGNNLGIEKSTTNEIDNSICKSELLFSPVKENQHISTDSLDLDAYPDDGDIILTCQANKNNYTIAFEGSGVYSADASFCAAESNDIKIRNKQNFINLHSNLDDIVKRKSLEVSMCRSDNAFTTWSKIKKNSTLQLQRYPSGNNNSSVNIIARHSPHCIVRKSSSLPNLRLKKNHSRQLNVSQALSTSTVESSNLRNLLPMCQMPISTTSVDDISPDHTTSSSNKMHTTESSSKQHNLNQPAFNLVKLFIKQKSSSTDTCMDVSSGCWPSSDGSSSLEQQQNCNHQQQRCRKKFMNDSGKGSALSKHAEENNQIISLNTFEREYTADAADSSYQLDSLDTCDQSSIVTNKDSLNTTPKRNVKTDLYREVFSESPKHRIGSRNMIPQHLRNPQIHNLTVQNNNNINNNNSLSSDASRTSDNLTQICCGNTRMKIPSDVNVMSRSIQTSILLKDRLRFVPPSFLAKLNKLGTSGGNGNIEKPAPVYVIYPNYSLPDLGFVKHNLSDVVLSPFNYKTALAAAATTMKKVRPTSFTLSDEEKLKNINHKHISDWKSLVTLLPIEYRKRLKHIPEADIATDPECSMKPMFCMTPPLRKNIAAIKNNICDCATYIQQHQQQQCTSSSGSSQPPSSGFRGSSTLLTDSDFDAPTLISSPASTAITNINEDPLKNLFLHQYENNRIDSEVLQQEQQLPPNGRTPRGILRRNLRSSPSSIFRPKRNSMFEEENSTIRNAEKRRSLQEPPYNYMYNDQNIIEEYLVETAQEDKLNQYYDQLSAENHKFNNGETNFIMDKANARTERKSRRDREYRPRTENFLSTVSKTDLKFYSEIASILECSETSATLQYDAAKLKNEVSRALSQKKVSFNNSQQPSSCAGNYLNIGANQKFSTPPNSPNISMAGLRVNSNGRSKAERKEMSAAEKERQNKIASNRFKRLQIQWELLSKDSSMILKDLASEKETKSGGSTPTSAHGQRSKIPRPVSYPASNRTIADTRHIQQSPSRIVPPKKYNGVPSSACAMQLVTGKPIVNSNSNPSLANVRTRTPNARASSANNNSSTPKQRMQSPRAATRTR